MPPTSTNSPKRRAACDTCRVKKLRCDGEQPTCGRCGREAIACVYGTQAPMGRPKKRQRTEEEEDLIRYTRSRVEDGGVLSFGHHALATTSSDSAACDTSLPPFDINAFSTAFTTEGNPQPWIFPPFDIDSNVPHTEDIPSLTSAASPTSNSSPQHGQTGVDMNAHLATPFASCACLSTMYLTLNELTAQSADPTFPSALHPLRNAMHTASTVLACEVCPKRFLTGLQNVQLLGTLLVSLALTYHRLLLSIRAETAQLNSANQPKSLALATLSPNPTSITISLPPSAYASLALSALKLEIHGPPSPTAFPPNPTLSSLLSDMEQRQRRYHSHGQVHRSENFPSGFGSEQEKESSEPLCLKLVAGARKIVEGLDWSEEVEIG